MVSVQAWFEVGQHDPIPLEEASQVDSLLDRMAAEAAEADVPVAAMIEWPEPDNRAVLQFGVRPHGRTGFVGFITKDGSVVSDNGADAGDMVAYDYMGSETPVDARAEIALADVRRTVRHFVVGRGARDDAITWREL
jgi:hypothetical protein